MDRQQFITRRDIDRSRTLRNIPDLILFLQTLNKGDSKDKILDVGCGYGGLTMLVANYLNIKSIYGVDIDKAVLPAARKKGVKAKSCDVGKDRLPYPNDYFDLVICFGMLDYLPSFDNAISEMHRVLKPGGEIIISLPNLASWNNRISLLLGYQPRDIEVSKKFIVGTHPYYQLTRAGKRPIGHIHTVTIGAFSQLAENFGFETVSIKGFSPEPPKGGIIVRWLDSILKNRTELARRFIWLGKKLKKLK